MEKRIVGNIVDIEFMSNYFILHLFNFLCLIGLAARSLSLPSEDS